MIPFRGSEGGVQWAGGRSKSRISAASSRQEMQSGFCGDLGAIAGGEGHAIDGQAAADDMDIGQSAGAQRVVEQCAGNQQAGHRRASWPMVVLPSAPSGEATRRQRPRMPSTPVPAVRSWRACRAGQARSRSAAMRFWSGSGLNSLCMMPFAGRHALHLAAPDDAAVAQAVLVLQRAGQDVGDDFHVAMAVRAEARAGRDAILVDDAQDAPAHFGRIVIVGEGEAVFRPQPAVVGQMAALLGRSDDDHGESFVN